MTEHATQKVHYMSCPEKVECSRPQYLIITLSGRLITEGWEIGVSMHRCLNGATSITYLQKDNKRNYSLRPLREPFLRVESVGIGVTSSIRPILRPARARALRAD
jgi:hypothetical protein